RLATPPAAPPAAARQISNPYQPTHSHGRPKCKQSDRHSTAPDNPRASPASQLRRLSCYPSTWDGLGRRGDDPTPRWVPSAAPTVSTPVALLQLRRSSTIAPDGVPTTQIHPPTTATNHSRAPAP